MASVTPPAAAAAAVAERAQNAAKCQLQSGTVGSASTGCGPRSADRVAALRRTPS